MTKFCKVQDMDNPDSEIINSSFFKGKEYQNRILLMGDFNVKEINWIEVEATGGRNLYHTDSMNALKIAFCTSMY